jgi:hypothetical protein
MIESQPEKRLAFLKLVVYQLSWHGAGNQGFYRTTIYMIF